MRRISAVAAGTSEMHRNIANAGFWVFATMALIACSPASSPRPEPRPSTMAGSVCGVSQIKGEAIAAIPGRLPGCGVANPVRVTEVSGVRLSQAAIMDCTTAKALNSWVRQGAIPAVGNRGGGLAELRVAAHYSCRTRNNQPGARISEHGKGRAIDISGVILQNGELITVQRGWHERRDRSIIRELHSAACGPFGTVLGPNADRFHQNHLHFDTAQHRGGPYCR